LIQENKIRINYGVLGAEAQRVKESLAEGSLDKSPLTPNMIIIPTLVQI
jgi:hypothetical protein